MKHTFQHLGEHCTTQGTDHGSGGHSISKRGLLHPSCSKGVFYCTGSCPHSFCALHMVSFVLLMHIMIYCIMTPRPVSRLTSACGLCLPLISSLCSVQSIDSRPATHSIYLARRPTSWALGIQNADSGVSDPVLETNPQALCLPCIRPCSI